MLTREQIKVLNSELKEAKWISSNSIAKKRCPETKQVRAARRVIARHDARVHREENKIDGQYERLKARARHAIYFGTEREATKAIRAVLSFYMAHSGR